MIKDYFFKMGVQEYRKVKEWYVVEIEKEEKTAAQEEFLNIIKMALRVINYDYEIATIEPSDGKGGLYYRPSEEIVGDKQTWYYRTWRDKAKRFAPEYHSRLANLYELFLWYAYRIAMNYWTIEEVCDDSSEMGNYLCAKWATGMVETSCQRECGGFLDGIGNTYRLVTLEDGFCSVGGSAYDGSIVLNISYVQYGGIADDYGHRTSGILVLRR